MCERGLGRISPGSVVTCTLTAPIGWLAGWLAGVSSSGDPLVPFFFSGFCDLGSYKYL